MASAPPAVKIRGAGRQRQTRAVKLHLHGEAGEYLPPVDRHRVPNPFWYEDWSVDFTPPISARPLPSVTSREKPLSTCRWAKSLSRSAKDLEVKPIRQGVEVSAPTPRTLIEIEKVLPWREQGWVTADTHVHFLSPPTALRGAAEGVNIVNLLASQWGELMTNVGDFDGKTTFGSREAGGEGEYLVRVARENRQHVLGHISLLGYNGSIIAPMTSGGPDESALGDPVDILLTEWARQCNTGRACGPASLP